MTAESKVRRARRWAQRCRNPPYEPSETLHEIRFHHPTPAMQCGEAKMVDGALLRKAHNFGSLVSTVHRSVLRGAVCGLSGS